MLYEQLLRHRCRRQDNTRFQHQKRGTPGEMPQSNKEYDVVSENTLAILSIGPSVCFALHFSRPLLTLPSYSIFAQKGQRYTKLSSLLWKPVFSLHQNLLWLCQIV